MNRTLVFLAFCITLAGCASSRLPTEPVVVSLSEAADSVRVRVGQTIVVEGIRIRFTAVESDSRCPIDVNCVWSGDAVANIVVEQNCAACESPAFDLKLHTHLEPRRGEAYGFRVELLQLQPYPRAWTQIKPDAYSAWLRVTRVQ